MPFDMKELARRGAEVRVRELNEELAAIYRSFPDLRQLGPRGAQKGTIKHEETHGREASRGRRRKMTAAQRKAVGERMRKYWAARKAEAGAKKR